MNLRDAIFTKMLELPVGEIYDIHQKVKPENRPVFVETVKQLIDEDLMPDHFLEFSDDYTLLKKKPKQTHYKTNRNSP